MEQNGVLAFSKKRFTMATIAIDKVELTELHKLRMKQCEASAND